MRARGIGWVIGQFVIGAAILVAPIISRSGLPLPFHLLGILLAFLGGIIFLFGFRQLGTNLTPFPKPRTDHHNLVTTGIYSIIRHPIYSGFVIGALGWSLFWGSLVAFVFTVVLFIWFDFKARREESWLRAQYPDYTAYQSRIKKLIPFLY